VRSGSGDIDLVEFDRGLPLAVREKLHEAFLRGGTAGGTALDAEYSQAQRSALLEGRPFMRSRSLAEQEAIRSLSSSLLTQTTCVECGERTHFAMASFCSVCGSPL
jgi:hypothetical protein